MDTLAVAPSMIEALTEALKNSTDENISLSQEAALKLSKEIADLQDEVKRQDRDLKRPQCTNCGGSGWFNDSTEGGIPVRCHCWANYVMKLKAEIKSLREIQDELADQIRMIRNLAHEVK